MRALLVAALLLALAGPALADAAEDLLNATGLTPVKVDAGGVSTLQKTHRGCPAVVQVGAGDVWGRWLARVVAGEASRSLPAVLRLFFEEPGQGIVGSDADRLLSRLIGHPLALVVVLDHGRPDLPRLDLYGPNAVSQPADPPPEVAGVGGFVGSLHCADAAWADAVLADEALLERLRRLRYPYIRVDGRRAGFYWAGNEMDFSGMIRDHGDYASFLLAVMDDLADLVEKAPPPAGE